MNDTDPPGRGPEDGWGLLARFRWRVLLGDLLFVAAWVGVVSFGWGVFRWPTGAYYLVVFGGIVLYSITGVPWVRSDDG